MLARFAAFSCVVACGSSSSTTRQEPGANTKAKPVAAKPADQCEQVIAKSRTVIAEILEKYANHKATEDDYTMMLDNCRKNEDPRREQFIACVIDAPDEPTVRTCWTNQLEAERSGDAVADARPDDRPEPVRYLERLAKNAKTIWNTNVEFTKGKAGPSPAAKCGCPKKCPMDLQLWAKDPIWQEIEFEVLEDSLYVYTYESDGKTFTATATADLDCDGKPGVWVLTGAGTNTSATTKLTPPPKGVN